MSINSNRPNFVKCVIRLLKYQVILLSEEKCRDGDCFVIEIVDDLETSIKLFDKNKEKTK